MTELAIATDYRGEGKSMESLRDTLKAISKAGFSHIHWCHEWDGEYLYSVYEMQQIRAWLQEYRLKVKAVHATKGSKRNVNRTDEHFRRDYTSDWECCRKAGVELIQNRVDLAAYLGAGEIVLHLYVPFESIEEGKIRKSDFYSSVKKSFDELLPYCMEKGVKICIEDLFDMPERYVTELWDWVIESYPAELMGICFDSGHANMIWHENLPQIAQKYRDRIFSVHLHDNFGEKDSHMIPGNGNINWEELMKALSSSAYRLPLVLETGCCKEEEEDYLKQVYQAGVWLTELFEDKNNLK